MALRTPELVFGDSWCGLTRRGPSPSRSRAPLLRDLDVPRRGAPRAPPRCSGTAKPLVRRGDKQEQALTPVWRGGTLLQAIEDKPTKLRSGVPVLILLVSLAPETVRIKMHHNDAACPKEIRQTPHERRGLCALVFPGASDREPMHLHSNLLVSDELKRASRLPGGRQSPRTISTRSARSTSRAHQALSSANTTTRAGATLTRSPNPGGAHAHV
jgi:hypothetical protein